MPRINVCRPLQRLLAKYNNRNFKGIFTIFEGNISSICPALPVKTRSKGRHLTTGHLSNQRTAKWIQRQWNTMEKVEPRTNDHEMNRALLKVTSRLRLQVQNGHLNLLYFGSIRIYILMTGRLEVVSNETN